MGNTNDLEAERRFHCKNADWVYGVTVGYARVKENAVTRRTEDQRFVFLLRQFARVGKPVVR
jgi:hypothetical protein